MLLGAGSTSEPLTETQVSDLLQRAFEPLALTGKRVLIIIPDGTRSAPLPLFFRLLNEHLYGRVAQLDYLIALGTHPPLSEAAIASLVGLSAEERAHIYPGLRIFNHQWDQP